jgi:hypothetical protein
VAVFRSTDITGLRHYLRIEDPAAASAMVTAYESMTDIDTGTAPYPATTAYWEKLGASGQGSAVLVGDARGFYLQMSSTDTYYDARLLSWFGDFAPRLPADQGASLLVGGTRASDTYLDNGANLRQAYTDSRWLARSHTQDVGPVSFSLLVAGNGDVGRYGLASPDPVSGGGPVFSGPIHVIEGGTIHRGHLPGVYAPLHVRPEPSGTLIEPDAGLLLLVWARSGAGESGCIAFDLEGPWER